MMLSNVIVDVTIPRCAFVFGQSRTQVSAGFTNVRSLEVAAFDHSNTDSNSQTNSGHVTTATIPYIRSTSETIARIWQPYVAHDCLLMSRTKTNQRTDREQYTRSNAATARFLTFWWNRQKPKRATDRTQMHKKECLTYSTDYYQRLTLELRTKATES